MQNILNIILVTLILKQLYNFYLIYKAPTISKDEVKKLAKKDMVFVDVRTDSEYNRGHIKGAKHIPLSQLKKRVAEIPQDSKVIVVCASGTRSARATMRIIKAGYTDVVSLKGGMAAWK